MLTFNNHIASMCRKAARQLAVLKRIGHLLTIKGKLAIFNSFIESNFNYCPLIWHFCSQTNTKKLEKIQERALRFIYNNYSSTHNDLLKTAGTQYLHVKRLKRMACEVFKIVNNMSPSFINPFYTSHMASKYTHVTRTFGEKSMLQKINPPTVFQILFPRVLHCLHAIVIHQMKDKECSISNI